MPFDALANRPEHFSIHILVVWTKKAFLIHFKIGPLREIKSDFSLGLVVIIWCTGRIFYISV